MITLYDEEPGERPSGVRTRMTLTPLDSVEFEEQAAEFLEVPDTFFMFLDQLRTLSIEVHRLGEDPVITTYSKAESRKGDLYIARIEKSISTGSSIEVHIRKYYTIKTNCEDLPFDEERKDKAGNSIDSATVILAFPVDDNNEPIIKPSTPMLSYPCCRRDPLF